MDSGLKVAIIGGLGVGMAHAIACSRLGYNVSAIVDTNIGEAYKRYCKGEWENIWGPYHEKFENAYTPTIMSELENLFLFGNEDKFYDLIIISTPTNTHISILSRLLAFPNRFGHIMCEKPLSHECEGVEGLIRQFGMDFLNEKVSVGYKWLYHPKFEEAKEKALIRAKYGADTECRIDEGHKYPHEGNWKMDYSIIYDLGCHAIAHMFKITGLTEANDWSMLRPVDDRQNRKASAYFRSKSNKYPGYWFINVGYEEFTSSDGTDGESIICDVPMAWCDLFDIQITELIKGNRLANFEFGYEIDKLMRRWEIAAR